MKKFFLISSALIVYSQLCTACYYSFSRQHRLREYEEMLLRLEKEKQGNSENIKNTSPATNRNTDQNKIVLNQKKQ